MKANSEIFLLYGLTLIKLSSLFNNTNVKVFKVFNFFSKTFRAFFASLSQILFYIFWRVFIDKII